MPTSRYYPNLRRTEQRQNQIDQIQAATGITGFASAIDYALAQTVTGLPERRDMPQKRLWVIDWEPGNPSVIPSPELCPDFEDTDIEVLVADQFFTVVCADYDTLDSVVRPYPYWRITGRPVDGCWRNEGGDGIYIYNGTVLDTEEELWDALGLKPESFGVASWDDLDDYDLVRDQVPAF